MFYKVFGAIFFFNLVMSVNLPTAICDQQFQTGQPHQEKSNGNRNLSAEKLKALDSGLAKALELYYNKDYEKALPIFQDIARQQETSDLIFLMGKCEARTGEYESSIEKFQQLLSEDPNLYRVRLDLADSFIMAGRYDEAREELKKVETVSAPQSILDEVDKRYAHIARIKKFSWRLSLFLGGEYDDNINSGPDRTEIYTNGDRMRLSKEQKEIDSYNFISGLRYYTRYDIGKPKGFFWNGEIDAYNSISEEDSDFNYLSVDLSTGPWWLYPGGIVRLPVGYTDEGYGDNHLLRAFYFHPDIEHFFNKIFSIQGAYTFRFEDYTHSEYRAYDNTTNRVSIGPNFYLDNMRHILSGSLSLEYRDADADRTTFDAVLITLSYFTKFPTNTEVLLKYRWRERNYDGHSGFSEKDRTDRRNTFYATIAQEFLDRFFLSFDFTYMDNYSNDKLYDFDKTVYALKVGSVF